MQARILEELGVQYEVRHYHRNPATRLAPPEYKALHPLGKAPLIELDGVMISESGAIIEPILRLHANSGLRPDGKDPQRSAYDLWMHFAKLKAARESGILVQARNSPGESTTAAPDTASARPV